MKIALFVALVILAAVVLDRLGRFLEDRGYIYYRKKSASSGALGNAFLQVQSMIDPAAQHVLEIRQDEHEEQDDSGEPPEPSLWTTDDETSDL